MFDHIRDNPVLWGNVELSSAQGTMSLPSASFLLISAAECLQYTGPFDACLHATSCNTEGLYHT